MFEVAATCVKAGGKRFTSSVSPQAAPSVVVDQPVVEPVVKQTKDVPTPPPQGPEKSQVKPLPTNPPEDWLKPKIFKSSTIA